MKLVIVYDNYTYKHIISLFRHFVNFYHNNGVFVKWYFLVYILFLVIIVFFNNRLFPCLFTLLYVINSKICYNLPITKWR